jgi:hypothetical protein
MVVEVLLCLRINAFYVFFGISKTFDVSFAFADHQNCD